jgi:FAD:protein FMN transferase
MTSVCVEIRRARPLLGTVVEIAAAASSRVHAHAAIDAAFAAVERMHRLMSFHEPVSDVSRLNRGAAEMAVAVHAWTYGVLVAAEDFRRVSGGLFDVAIAPHLQSRGLLPLVIASPGLQGTSPLAGIWAKRSGEEAVDCFVADAPCNDARIILLPDNKVRFSHPNTRIDLGGIAKGFAADRAADALREFGIAQGMVNAGGDVVVFGAPRTIAVRDPRDPGSLLAKIVVADGAVASSARGVADAAPSAIVDPHTGRAPAALGATVLAHDGLTADALTKLVMLRGRDAGSILDRFAACALFVSPSGEVHATCDWPEAQTRAA